MVSYLDDLIERGRSYGDPRVHGNGFIQLDVDDWQRLHFWGHSHIPVQEQNTPIHDHVFSFTSHILKGAILNINYTIEETKDSQDGIFQEWIAYQRQGSDTGLKPNGKYANLRGIEARVWRAPEVYAIERGMLHESIVREPTITLIRKDGKTTAQNPEGPMPRVMVPVGKVADNEFDRHGYHVPFLWMIIKEIKDA